jgi:hypothetical protein
MFEKQSMYLLFLRIPFDTNIIVLCRKTNQMRVSKSIV